VKQWRKWRGRRRQERVCRGRREREREQISLWIGWNWVVRSPLSVKYFCFQEGILSPPQTLVSCKPVATENLTSSEDYGFRRASITKPEGESTDDAWVGCFSNVGTDSSFKFSVGRMIGVVSLICSTLSTVSHAQYQPGFSFRFIRSRELGYGQYGMFYPNTMESRNSDLLPLRGSRQ